MRHSRPESVARVSRRQWATWLAATPLAAQVTSPPVTQKTPPQGSPASASPAATPDGKLQKAYDDIRETSDRLAKLEVPMNVEPAFVFKP